MEISAKKQIFSRDLATFTIFNNEVVPIAPKAQQSWGFGCCRTVSTETTMLCAYKDSRRETALPCFCKGFITRAIELSIKFHHQMASCFPTWKSSDR
jgi:hypothetical protein